MAAFSPRPPTFDVHVVNIPLNARNVKHALEEAFSKFGAIRNISIRENEFCMTAYVRYMSEASAKNSIVELNRTFFQGSRLNVSKGKWNNQPNDSNGMTYPTSRGRFSTSNSSYRSSQREPAMADQPLQKPSGTLEAMVTSVEDCCSFWAQLTGPENVKKIYNLTSKLKAYCMDCPQSVENPNSSEVYAAIYEGDDNWYRCKVLDLTDTQCLIRFIDFGNSCIGKVSDLRSIPEHLQTEILAFQFAIAGLSPDLEQLQKTEEVLDALRELLMDQVVIVEILGENESECLVSNVSVRIDNELVDLGQRIFDLEKNTCNTCPAPSDSCDDDMLINTEDEFVGSFKSGTPERFVSKMTALESEADTFDPRTPDSSENGDSDPEPVVEDEIPSPVNEPSYAEIRASITGSSPSPLLPSSPGAMAGPRPLLPPTARQGSDGWPRLTMPPTRPTLNWSSHGGFRSTAVAHTATTPNKSPVSIAAKFGGREKESDQEGSEGMMKREMAKKNSEIHHLNLRVAALEDSKRQLIGECGSLKSRVNALQRDLGSRLTLQNKLQVILSQLSEVQDTRSKTVKDPVWIEDLTSVVEMLSNPDNRISIEGLASIDALKDSLSKVEKLQGDIRACSSKEDVVAITAQRDDARKGQLTCIDQFLKEAEEKLKHGAIIEELQSSLAVVQERVLGDRSSSSVKPKEESDSEVDCSVVLQGVQDWQGGRTKKLNHLKFETTSSVFAFSTAMESLQKEFTASRVTASPKEVPDIEDLLESILATTGKESQALHEVLTEPVPAGIVGSVAKLFEVVQNEMKELQLLRDLHGQYSSLRTVILECIGTHVSTEALQLARKSSRDLRRQFGHKMVDRRELSVDPSSGSLEELEMVDAEIVAVRVVLHCALAEEQRQSAFLSKYLEEFPELVLLHPELNLKQVQMFHGLLSPGRSLEHFKVLGEVEGYEVPTYRSQFLDSPCILEEYSFNSSEDLDAIVTNANRLNSIPSNAIAKVVCISPDWNKSTVLLQVTDYFKEDLPSFMSAPRSSAILKTIFGRVLEILDCFHAQGCSYGSLRGTSIRVNCDDEEDGGESNCGVGADASVGDVEVQLVDCDLTQQQHKGHEATPALGPPKDMYNFGLVLLQAFVGQEHIEHDVSGRPILHLSSEDPILSSLLNGLLHLEPKLRISAKTTLKHDFFQFIQ